MEQPAYSRSRRCSPCETPPSCRVKAPSGSVAKWFIPVAVPEAEHYDHPICFLHEVEDTVGPFEDGQFLRPRVRGAVKMASGPRSAWFAQLPNCFGRKVVRVSLSARAFIAIRPVGDDFLEVVSGALGEYYPEFLRGHRSCTFAMNSSAP